MQLNDWLDDLCVRFIVNLPHDELSTVERVGFHMEEAHWFYEDFARLEDRTLPSLSLRSFCLLIFQRCSIFAGYPIESYRSAFDAFMDYKTRVPVRGAILLNHDMDHVVLVKGWKKGSSWSFPRGKIANKELDIDCAVREVQEETGFNFREAGLGKQEFAIDNRIREQDIRLYVVRDVPMDTHFEPQVRKEISQIKWYPLKELPTYKKLKEKSPDHPQESDATMSAKKFYMVAPFMNPLKQWIARQKKEDARRSRATQRIVPSQAEELMTEEEPATEYETDYLPPRDPGPAVQVADKDQASARLLSLLNRPSVVAPTKAAQDPAQLPPPSTATSANAERSKDLFALLQKGTGVNGKLAGPPNVGNTSQRIPSTSQSNVQPAVPQFQRQDSSFTAPSHQALPGPFVFSPNSGQTVPQSAPRSIPQPSMPFAFDRRSSQTPQQTATLFNLLTNTTSPFLPPPPPVYSGSSGPTTSTSQPQHLPVSGQLPFTNAVTSLTPQSANPTNKPGQSISLQSLFGTAMFPPREADLKAGSQVGLAVQPRTKVSAAFGPQPSLPSTQGSAQAPLPSTEIPSTQKPKLTDDKAKLLAAFMQPSPPTQPPLSTHTTNLRRSYQADQPQQPHSQPTTLPPQVLVAPPSALAPNLPPHQANLLSSFFNTSKISKPSPSAPTVHTPPLPAGPTITTAPFQEQLPPQLPTAGPSSALHTSTSVSTTALPPHAPPMARKDSLISNASSGLTQTRSPTVMSQSDKMALLGLLQGHLKGSGR